MEMAMMKKIIQLAVILFLTASSIFAGGCIKRRILCSTPEERADFFVSRIASSLDLTKEQVDKVNKIKDELLARTKTSSGERETTYKELIEMVKNDKLNRDSVENFINKREAKMKELKPFIIDKIVEFHYILTPEQRNKVAEKLDKFFHYCD
jgi:protein CpxP